MTPNEETIHVPTVRLDCTRARPVVRTALSTAFAVLFRALLNRGTP